MMSLSRRQIFRASRLAPILLFLFLADAARAATAPQTIAVAAGGHAILELTENPSTGYVWRLSEAESSNLGLVSISDAGFRRGINGAPAVGAPGLRLWRINGRAPGLARLVFVYARP